MKSPSHTPRWAADARLHLLRVDPVMKRIIERSAPLQIERRPEGFQALVRAIIFQQLAGSAALAIFNRFVAIVGGGRFPTPDQVIAVADEDLRKAGLSRGKMAYIRDLALRVRDGAINFRRFPKMADEEIIAELTQVRGIGRWTAEMFLIFNLGRPDVLAVGDLGLRSAATREYATLSPVTEKILREMGESWRPYRSAASVYLWRSARTVTVEATEVVESKSGAVKAKAVKAVVVVGRAKTARSAVSKSSPSTARAKPRRALPITRKHKPRSPASV